jgi:nicotinate-nucleotide adenylyltransferase
VAPEAIAVLGGTFDPPHLAHLAMARLVLERTGCSVVLIVPCIRHPLGKVAAPFEHRLRMCRLLADDAGDGIEVSDIEGRLGLSGRTIEMLEALAGEHPGARLRLVIGSDILEERDRWHRFDDVVSLAEPIHIARQGHEAAAGSLPAPAPISSTRIRAMLAAGRRPGELLPSAVLDYIEEHGLYGPVQP